MIYLVTDTHPLVWYIEGSKRLPKKVRQAFDDAVEGKSAIWVPIIALWELSLLEKAGKIRIMVSLDELVSTSFFSKAIHLLDLMPQDIIEAHSLNFSKDPFDTIIVAMARRMNCPLITGDTVIHAESPCNLFWD